jgi:hypothetical protein
LKFGTLTCATPISACLSEGASVIGLWPIEKGVRDQAPG